MTLSETRERLEKREDGGEERVTVRLGDQTLILTCDCAVSDQVFHASPPMKVAQRNSSGKLARSETGCFNENHMAEEVFDMHVDDMD